MATHTSASVAFSRFNSVRGRGNAAYSLPLFQKVQNEYDILFENQSKPLGRPADPLLTAVLDAGEAATIALAIQESAAVVIMDEAKGRGVARNVYGLRVIGTGRVLVEAKRGGFISEVSSLIEQLRSKGYWMSDAIVAEILKQAGE